MLKRLSSIVLIAAALILAASFVAADTILETLQDGQKIHGFTARVVYLDGADKPMGARFISDKYGFIVDLMQIQSVPQGFFWIKTPPGSDKGESHTCEHLLLGKGNRGRFVSALEDMSLGNSTAFTAQVRTCYHFNTIAGGESFYDILEAKLMAFLNPDFTDEEIRREVCHIGVNKDPQTGKLSLEEKGTVYTEMVSAFEKPWYHYFSALSHMMYGDDHPLSNISGGIPAALRKLTPEDLWKFHKETYHLANMGIIVSIPDNIPIDTFLERLGIILENCQETPTKSDFIGIDSYPLPEPKPAPLGAGQLVAYPSENEQDRGKMLFGWPADLDLNSRQYMMRDLFLSAFVNSQTSVLYNLFINSETRKIDLGGNEVWSWTPDYQGYPLIIGMEGLDNTNITETMIDSVRSMIIDEIQRVYDYADGSDELADFDREALSLLIRNRKSTDDYLNSPPMFGFRRGPAGGWLNNVAALEKEDGFRKSLVRKELFDYADSLLASGSNIWKDVINYAHLLTAKPYSVGSYPDPALVTQMAEDKKARILGYIEQFKKRYGVEDEQEAIARYKEEFDEKTAELDAIAAGQKLPGFIDNPPLTLDDQLNYEIISLNGEIPMVASSFDNMKSSTVGIALRLDVVPESLLVYVPFLPDVLTEIGVYEDGKAIPYEKMKERLRKEILRMNASFDFGFRTGRVELVLSAAGSNREELINALEWMNKSLYSPYLHIDNLPRMRDLLDQGLVSLRNRMKRSEEDWVDVPAYAYRYQSNPLFLTTNTFLTQIHHAYRLRCMLTDPGNNDDQKTLALFIDALDKYAAGKTREELVAFLEGLINSDETGVAGFAPLPSKMTETAKDNTIMVARAFMETLPAIPDANLHDDWAYLCRQTKADIMAAPSDAIASISHVLSLIRKADNARMFMISSTADREATMEQVKDFASRLDSEHKSVRQKYDDTPRIVARLNDRESITGRPVYVGLVHEGTNNGVVIGSARFSEPYDTSTASIMELLSGKMYSGGGPHGLFMRTWAAGLAYSNGYGIGQASGRASYYAERCPDVSETMRFVVSELENAEDDPGLTSYAVAQVFGSSRAASRYESRGRAMASDLADGNTPEKVAAFRRKVVEVGRMDNLYDELKKLMPKTYGQVLIGYGPPMAESDDGYFFLIGPEPQFESLEQYIETTEGKQPIYRLYPRDFWLTMQ